MKVETFARIYTNSALVLFNTLLLFIAVNTIAYAVVKAAGKPDANNPVEGRYGKNPILVVYPHMEEGEIDALLKETWSRPYTYEPFTQFKESTYRGSYVNVDENGFRHVKEQAAWPPSEEAFNIFMFGGSTTFGYGAEDSLSVPSLLQEYLHENNGSDVRVYNFGRGHYFSSQERILFEQLIADGNVPDMAIFIDGLNDFYYHDDEPLFTRRLARFMRDPNGTRDKALLQKLPLVRAYRMLVGDEQDTDAGSVYDDPKIHQHVLKRYLANKRIIESVARSHGVVLAMIWQPVPTYNYDDSFHPFSSRGFGQHTYSRSGYAAVRKYADENDMGEHFLWAADIQEGLEEPLYVDLVHYSGAMSKRLATFIGQHLLGKHSSLMAD